MLYMVIEQFKDAPAIYRRFREKGRMMPDGLSYISSWIDTDLKVCYQLMETEDVALFQRWTENWDDLFLRVPMLRHATSRSQLGDHLIHGAAVRVRASPNARANFDPRIFGFHNVFNSRVRVARCSILPTSYLC